MVAKDLMRRDVFTVQDDQSVDELIHLLVREHIHGCPVVNRAGDLVGIVTQQDVFFSAVTRGRTETGGEGAEPSVNHSRLVVRDLMTSPAVSATEGTEILGLCRLMQRLRIHRIPIVKDGKVTGIVSALDIVGELANGRKGF
jgi:CBS domain-containing protein